MLLSKLGNADKTRCQKKKNIEQRPKKKPKSTSESNEKQIAVLSGIQKKALQNSKAQASYKVSHAPLISL